MTRRELLSVGLGVLSAGLIRRVDASPVPTGSRTMASLAVVNRRHPLAQGLQGWWLALPGVTLRANGWANLLGPPGTVVYETMASSATTTSGPGRSTSRAGGRGELRFDGTNDAAYVPHHARWNLGAGGVPRWTLTCWIYFAVVAAGIKMILTKSTANGGAVNPLEFRYDSSQFLTLNSDGGTNVLTSTFNPLGTTWQHLTLTRSGTGTALYLNGKLDATGPVGTFTANTQPLRFGRRDDATTSFLMQGNLDDIRVYNWALPARLVRELYRNSLAGYPGLLAAPPGFQGPPAAPAGGPPRRSPTVY
jgi:hypothetical protein